MKTRFLLTLQVEVAAAQSIGDAPHGTRRTVLPRGQSTPSTRCSEVAFTRRELLTSAGALVLTNRAWARVTERAPQTQGKEDLMKSPPLMTLRLETAPTQEIGSTPHGSLSIFPVIGGSFEGDRLRGKVLSGGSDWVAATPDGTFDLDLRVTLETRDGALIHMTFSGVRDDANHYFRTLPLFEAAAPTYAFLNRLLAVGIGEIRPEVPVHGIEEIL
jgi:Protein of unknown function (DUF3237)